MGGCTFSIMGRGKTAQEAYDELVAEAKHEDPYSGTIGTTRGFRMYQPKARFGTKAFHAEIEYQRVELKGKAARDARERFGAQRGVKYFYFFGVAAE